jgi:DNA-binding NtrC family response regulator
MKRVVQSILFFAEKDYPFIRSSIGSGRVRMVGEPSELVEAVKHDMFSIILFDMAHPRFSESLVVRVYRRTPLAEFWLLTHDEHHTLPEYMIDNIFSYDVRKAEFEVRIKAVLRIKTLLEEYHMVGKSANLKQVAEMISQVAPTDISTLIIGPSGSGKELVARALHRHSTRKDKPFIAVNCGALAEGLLESELFGHEKGAFTGAIGNREGIFKRADGGTVFLDEIGETSPALQVKLLRVLEEGNFNRVGGSELIHADIRVVAATNRELAEAIAGKEFREDLYYRLGAIRINLAGLAERKADIIPLINHFFREQTGTVRGISERAMETLIHYGWPGNVRQLRNFVSHMAVTAGDGEISEHHVTQFIEEQGYVERHLPVITDKTPQQAEFQLIYQALLSLGQEVRMMRDLIVENLPSGHEAVEPHDITYPYRVGSIEEVEEKLIKQTLESVGGNRRQAARRLGIGERTLYRKLKKYGID